MSLTGIFTPIIGSESDTGILPVDGRWDHPRYLTWRPGHNQKVTINPTRISWPYLPTVTPWKEREHPSTRFRLQIAKNPQFTRPKVDVVTEWNFYNALPKLGSGTW